MEESGIFLFLLSVTWSKGPAVFQIWRRERDWGDKDIYSAFLSTGVHSQDQLHQSGAELQQPGTSVKMPCKATGYTFTKYRMRWVRQKLGQGLEWIASVDPGNSNTEHNQKFKGKATLTEHKSSITAYIELSSLTSEDSVVYYCTRHSVITTSCVWQTTWRYRKLPWNWQNLENSHL